MHVNSQRVKNAAERHKKGGEMGDLERRQACTSKGANKYQFNGLKGAAQKRRIKLKGAGAALGRPAGPPGRAGGAAQTGFSLSKSRPRPL